MLIVINKMEIANLSKKIMLLLLKNLSKENTISTIAEELKISRVGAWKILKKLELNELITLKQIGNGKTNVYIASIKYGELTERRLALYLAEEAHKQKRWMNNFIELKKYAEFIIIYGSILYNPEKANDIDLVIIADKKNFIKIERIINKIEKTQAKKVHFINFTGIEFQKELETNNKAFINSIKEGVVLFGQEKFIDFVRNKKWIN